MARRPPLLLELLARRDVPPERRVFAVRFIGLIGRGASEVAPALLQLVADPGEDLDTRRWGADALGRIDGPGDATLAVLRPLARSADPWSRLLASGALLKLRPDDPAPLAELGQARTSEDLALHSWGLSLTVEVCETYPAAALALLDWLDHWNDEHVEEIGRALARVPIAPRLMAALTSPRADLRRNALVVLGSHLLDPGLVVAAATAALSDPEEEVRWRAAGALHSQHALGADLLRAVARGVEPEHFGARRLCQALLEQLGE
ncbi:MAG: HEAT repeat domain-containing protein [Planctomycetota bacterium]|nr:HEAT repeat domain-containing protein [Planctomycetota bacterium]